MAFIIITDAKSSFPNSQKNFCIMNLKSRKTMNFYERVYKEEKRLIKEYYSKYNRFIFCENTVESITKAISNIESGSFGDVKNEAIDDFMSEKVAKQLLG